jgi:hypothetical protein
MAKNPVGLKNFKIEMVPIDQLHPYPGNPKTHPDEQVEKIARSIQEFGVVKNIIINGANEIIAGHGSVLAYEKLGYTEAPCYRMTKLTPVQERALRIADNKTQESEWFPEALAQEIEDLKKMNFDVSLTGFGEDDIILPGEGTPYQPQIHPPADGSPGEEGVACSGHPPNLIDLVCPNCGEEFLFDVDALQVYEPTKEEA